MLIGVKRIAAIVPLLATLLVAGATLPSCGVSAEGAPTGACAESCKLAYGACYKGSHNRETCLAQLHRCLQGCDVRKR